MGHARNQIDVSKIRGENSNSSKRVEKVVVDAYAQRTNVGSGCSWSTATAFRQFQRDSEAKDQAHSDSESHSTNNSTSHSWDRSRNWANGWAWSFEVSRTLIDGFGQGESSNVVQRVSNAGGGTGSMAPHVNYGSPLGYGYNMPDPSGYFTPIASGYGLVDSVVNFFVWVGNLGNAMINAGNVVVNKGTPIYSPGRSNEDCPMDEQLDKCDPNVPSFGRSWTDRFSLGLTLPTFGSLKVSWVNGASFNQNFVCSSGSTNVDGKSSSYLDYEETTIADGNTQSRSHDEDHTRRDSHSRAESHRRGNSRTDAASSGIGRSRGDSRSGSDRSGHAQRESNGQSTSDFERNRTVKGSGSQDSKTVTTARYWNQIFQALNQMWQGTMLEIQTSYKTLSGRQGFKLRAIPESDPRVGCAPIFNEFIRTSSTPCYAPCGTCAR